MVFTLRLLLGGIFIIASISKIQAPADFVNTVIAYGMLPDGLASIYGWITPWLELLIGSALVLGVFLRLAAWFSLPLIISFIIASSFAYIQDPSGVCGCFGNFFKMTHPISLGIDLLMTLAACGIIINRPKAKYTFEDFLLKVYPGFTNKPSTTRKLCLVLVVCIMASLISTAAYLTRPKYLTNNDVINESITILEPFRTQVTDALNTQKPAMIIVSAEDCNACEIAKPVLDELEETYKDSVFFIHIEYAAYPLQIKEMDVKNTPTVLLVTGVKSGGVFNLYRKYINDIHKDTLEQGIVQAINLTK